MKAALVRGPRLVVRSKRHETRVTAFMVSHETRITKHETRTLMRRTTQ